MAFTEFYIDSGGNDMNAGTVVNAAASVTSTNGSWDITANTFIATAGTPFASVAVGEWASIYVDGTTSGAVYIAQVTGLHVAGLGVVLSTTAIYGTKPSASATTRSCKIGGSHLSELPWASGGLGATTVPASTRVNWKKGTYTIVASRTFSIAGTATAPLWFRGYDTTPGDCDSNPALTRPTLALNATFAITTSGAQQIWSSVNVTGARSGTIWTSGAASLRIIRCRSENTSSNAAAIAITLSTTGQTVAYSWFKTPTTATTSGTVLMSSGATLIGCVSEGGGLATYNMTGTTQVPIFIGCISLNATGDAWLTSVTTGGLLLFNCLAYNPTRDGVRFSAITTGNGVIASSLFATCSGVGINNATGGNLNTVFRTNNDFYNCGANEAGFGDTPSLFEQTESVDPFVSVGTNFGLIATANAIANGFAPGGFENLASTLSYLAIGPVQPQGSAGGMLVHPGLSGRLQ